MPASNKRQITDLGRVGGADLAHVPALEDCHPGLEPMEYNVVVAPAVMPEKLGSLFIPDESRDMIGMGLQVGRIIAQSPLAHGYDTWPDPSKKPQVGDIVWFGRFAGGEFEGRDGRKGYRILKDKDIGAVIERAAPPRAQSQQDREAAIREAMQVRAYNAA